MQKLYLLKEYNYVRIDISQKSLNRVKSPEDLNDYIRVANPGVWLVLVAVVILLAGVCIWGLFRKT